MYTNNNRPGPGIGREKGKIYDFSVLTWGPFARETNEEDVKEYLDEWLEYGPSEELREKARNDLAERGYIEMGV